MQVDLVFDRADNVMTICEMKYSSNKVGVDVIAQTKRKIGLLRSVARGKTVQPVLIVRDRPSREVLDEAFFYRIIEAREFLQQRE